MALTNQVVSAHSESTDASTITTGTHTPTAAPTGVYVFVGYRQIGASVISGVTYGGSALAMVKTSVAADGRFAALWKLESAVPTGAQTATVTFSGNVRGRVVYVLTLTAGSGSIAVSDSDTGTGSGAVPFTVTANALTSAAGENTYGFICVNHGGSALAPQSGESEISENAGRTDAGGERCQIQSEAGAASVTQSWTVSTQGTDAAWVVASIQEVSGGGGGFQAAWARSANVMLNQGRAA